MKNVCPNCKNILEAEHSFCPYCAFGLGDDQPDTRLEKCQLNTEES